MAFSMALPKLKMLSVIILCSQRLSLLGLCKCHLCRFLLIRWAVSTESLHHANRGNLCESHGGRKTVYLRYMNLYCYIIKALQKGAFLPGVKLLYCIIYHQISKTSGQLFYFPFKNQRGKRKVDLTFTLLFAKLKIMCFLFFPVSYVIFTFSVTCWQIKYFAENFSTTII